MKRVGILFILCSLLMLCGCQGSIYNNYRDLESLRPVQTLGIDGSSGSVTVSVAAGESQSDGLPAVLCQSADSIEAALVQLQNAFAQAQPYYAHVQYLLFGSEAAEQGMGHWLEWVERSPELRLDASVFVVRESAAELILSAAGEQGGTSEKLSSLYSELRTLGEGTAVSVRELAASLADDGTALCSAIRCADESDRIRFDSSAAVVPDGFAVFRDGALAGFIEQDDAAGLLLLLNKPDGARVTLEDESGFVAAVRLGEGRTNLELDGGVAAVRCEVEAVVMESEGAVDAQTVCSLLSEALRGQIDRVLALETSLGCDFLDLLDAREGTPAEFSVSVEVQLDHSYGRRVQEGQA